MEIVGYEVVEARISESLDSGRVNCIRSLFLIPYISKNDEEVNLMDIHTREQVTQLRTELETIVQSGNVDKAMVMVIANELKKIEEVLNSMDQFLTTHDHYDSTQITVEAESFMYFDDELIAIYNKNTREFEPVVIS